MKPTDIALCYGTRPQVIKASVLRRKLARVGRVLALDTGQHYDYELNALLYAQPQLRARWPDVPTWSRDAYGTRDTAARVIAAVAALLAA